MMMAKCIETALKRRIMCGLCDARENLLEFRIFMFGWRVYTWLWWQFCLPLPLPRCASSEAALVFLQRIWLAHYSRLVCEIVILYNVEENRLGFGRLCSSECTAFGRETFLLWAITGDSLELSGFWGAFSWFREIVRKGKYSRSQ